MAITLANTMPGHLAAPGKLSETHEFIRVQTIEIMLICPGELGYLLPLGLGRLTPRGMMLISATENTAGFPGTL